MRKKSQGKLNIILPTPNGDVPIETHDVSAPIPFLIGLNKLEKYGRNALTVQNELHSVKDSWKIPLTNKLSHMYLTWEKQHATHYSRQKLQTMPLHFMNTSVSEPPNHLERAHPGQVTQATK